ncbi:MAG: hypothetical protein M0T85_00730 [Dehalococcoidales bacterium]|nr:hypothetical protein [Dehalococcoidales bacterium]
MANTIITPQIIAREALMMLENNLVLAGLVYRNYSDGFARVGDTITIRKPATFTAQEFTSSITVQDATESSVQVQMNKHLDVSFAVTSKELSLSIQDFSAQLIQPAMSAIAQKVDELIASLYVDVPYVADVSGTPAAADLAAIGRVMNQNKVPLDSRRLVLDPVTHAKYVVLDPFLHADKSGSTDALREASMGRVLGLDSYMSQNVKTHSNGTFAVTSGTLTATVTAGATQVTASATACSGTLAKGSIITIQDVPGTYVSTADATAASNSITIPVYPALAASGSSKTVTIKAGHIANVAFHRNAFALVTRPLQAPLGAGRAEAINYNGLAVRAVYSYDINSKKDIISLDLLSGVKTLTPELAVRFCG